MCLAHRLVLASLTPGAGSCEPMGLECLKCNCHRKDCLMQSLEAVLAELIEIVEQIDVSKIEPPVEEQNETSQEISELQRGEHQG